MTLLSACGTDCATAPSAQAQFAATASRQGMSQCAPARGHQDDEKKGGFARTRDAVLAERCGANVGDLLDVALDELNTRQAVLGYDEVYFKLGRYGSNTDVLRGGFNKLGKPITDAKPGKLDYALDYRLSLPAVVARHK